MAGIDKTYTDSWVEYKEFKDWAEKQVLTFYNGHKVYIRDWVFEWDEEDFDGHERPVMNTPTWLDIFLIQNCKIGFVLDRMKQVYNSKSYEEFKVVDLTATPPKEFQTNRKITIKRTSGTKFPLHKKPYGGKSKWWLQCNDNFWFCTETKIWSDYKSYYPHNTNTANAKSIKGIVRHLRKQHLPVGVSFTLSGRYVGENYLVAVS